MRHHLELTKLLKDHKFLAQVEQAALAHKDAVSPYGRPELMRAYMWTCGVVDVLKARGFSIERLPEENE